MLRVFSTLVAAIALILPAGSRAFAQAPPLRATSPASLKSALPADMRCEEILGNDGLIGDYLLVIPEPFAAPVPATDPIYKQRTTRALYLYEGSEGASSAVRQRVVVHFDPDDRFAAIRSAHLIARLMRIHRQRFGREVSFRRGASLTEIWFVPTPPHLAGAGGETRDANVYVFAASAITATIELARTVAHEWGHETLPAARGYSEPENDASGYLGERLYLYYLLSDTLSRKKGNYADDGTSLETLRTYYDRQVKPLMERFADGGPSSNVLDGEGTEAMDYYIGAVLDSDATLGSRIVGDALYGIDDTSPRDFLHALESAVARKVSEGVFVNLRAWLPLGRGRYIVDPVSGGGRVSLSGPQSLATVADGPKSGLPKPRPGEKRDGTFRVTKPGWFRVSPSGSLSEYTIKSMGTAK